MIVKPIEAGDHMTHLEDILKVVRKYKMQINPRNCAFGVKTKSLSGTYLTDKWVEVIPSKYITVIDMEALKTNRGTQKLNRMLMLLSRSISKIGPSCVAILKIS